MSSEVAMRLFLLPGDAASDAFGVRNGRTMIWTVVNTLVWNVVAVLVVVV